MGKFAKLFEVNGEQILIKRQTNDDGIPQVKIIVEVYGTLAETVFDVQPKDDSPESLQDAKNQVQEYIDNLDQQMAEETFLNLTSAYANLLSLSSCFRKSLKESFQHL